MLEVYETQKHMYIAMECVTDGELYLYLNTHALLVEDQIALITYHILDAI